MKIRIAFIMLTSALLLSCQKKDNYDKLTMLGNTANVVVLEAQADLLEQASILRSKALDFEQQTDATSLNNFQTAWRQTATAWAKNELYRFGPVSERYLDLGMNNIPININSVNNILTDTFLIDSIYLRGLSTKNKGLGTLEYLLFQQEPDSTLWYFTQAPNASHRLAYAVENAKSIYYYAREIELSWKPEGGNYLNTFNSSDGTDIQSGISLLSNALISLTQNISRKKVGRPIGKENNDVLDPSLVQTPYASYSLLLVNENLKSIELAFNGGDGEGIDDYLNSLKNGEEVQININTKIDDAKAIITELNSNSLQDVLSTNTAKIDELYQKTRELLIIFETDMAALLNITVLPNINDGD